MISTICSSRRFFFFCKIASASAEKSGATMTSLKISAIASAHAPSSVLVHRNDAAKRRLFVRRKRLVPRLAQIRALADAARIRVFQNRQGRRVVRKFGDQIRRRRQIQNVVVGKFLAVKLLEKIVEPAVKRRRLMRIFAVTQRLHQRRGNRKQSGQRRSLART